MGVALAVEFQTDESDRRRSAGRRFSVAQLRGGGICLGAAVRVADLGKI